ncbi:LysR family transcriptional regulator [Salinibacterium sp. UTAS2018]|uniref:ABC transporter substrate-binding protein n=1 Tax=Salinibacterium sp. UTAS2018 TaxID=2508880 RepID=UPI0010095A39|nr:ABC transporter substrate-binding protein [Salinibacterium sp. UTAS2018]QAV70343.1 LysR family transcriptional regulator [Salinibacterium sp. UTAS2018]
MQDAPHDTATLDELTRALDLHMLRILVAIQETGSVSAAARRLGFSQPAITQHLKRSEARLSIALVARTPRGMELTEAGTLLARHAPRIDAAVTAAASDLTAHLGLDRGSVRLAAFPAAVASIIAPLLSRLAREFPGIHVEFSEAEPDAALSAVADGRADIALDYRYTSDHSVASSSHTSADGLRSRFLLSENVLAIVPRAVADQLGATASVSALLPFTWVGGPATCTEQLVAVATGLGEKPTLRHDVTTTGAALALVASGIGVTFLSELAIATTTLPDGVVALELQPKLRRRIYATTLDDSADTPSIAVALRLLAMREVARKTSSDRAALSQHSHLQRAKFASSPFTPPVTLTERHELRMRSTNSTLAKGARASTVAVAASALLLAGCATSSTPTGDGNIDTITVALPGSLSSLYVGAESGILNYYIASITQEGLVSIDADGALQPGLAESWDQPDDVTYVYELRDDAQFQDGTPVTADDVVFSLEQARDETSSPGLSYYLGGVDTVEKTGDLEVTITLSAPDSAFAANMSTGGAAFITSQKFWEENDGEVGTSSALLLGSGPYKVTEFVPDSHVNFERVDTWWGDLPEVKNINVKFIPDEGTRLLAAQSGDIDVAFNVPLAQSTQWEDLDNMRVDYVNDLSYVGMYFNTALEPFNDPKVREAFAHSVDRTTIVDKLLRGHGEVATAIATPESLGSVYSADDARDLLASIPQYDFDLDAAAAALAASDHPDGFETDILFPSTGPQLGTAAQSLAENLSKIGITLNVREVPIEEWLASLEQDSSYGVGLMWYFSTLGDPAEVSTYMLGDYNISNYENPEVLSLFERVGAETDPSARIDLLIEAETLQAEDVISVPLWWGQSATAFSKDIDMSSYSSFAFISAWPTLLTPAG